MLFQIIFTENIERNIFYYLWIKYLNFFRITYWANYVYKEFYFIIYNISNKNIYNALFII